jgi:hypothetical protein
MSTPEQPETPQLTRKQLRDIRNTGAMPIIDTASVITADEVPTGAPADDAPVAPPPFEESLPPVVAPPSPAGPLARAAEPVFLPEPPAPDRSVDLGVTPLTRRQARQQERIRTASVPVITPEISAAYASQSLVAGSDAPPAGDAPADEAETADTPREDSPFASVGLASGPIAQVDEAPAEDANSGEVVDEEPVSEVEQESPPAEAEEQSVEPDEAAPAEVEEAEIVEESENLEEPAALEEPATDAEPAQEVTRTVAPDFGAALLAGGGPVEHEPVSSFDDLITRSSSGSVATPNALILSQIPDGGSIVAPVNATGEVLITGTFNLPEGLGSTGHAVGTADGKETDAVLVDGELPAHSSPTPIAASAAISTAKQPGEIIKPPTPEKGGKLMLTLAITAGVLALALVGVLILAVTTGVF